ncbi:glycosyl hydrolase family 17 protein [Maribacter polysaccharolyticus]|uniref:glycosyl hydrolase family 17 protein n=1 Tax=Maribacter polysaccharolyticus TaxID=3020831 RepID=UPI00237EF103|nr:glycosyl hydrolase family 17 protein [Maribacter polysaccharolyticus]MDE3743787.1 glycosyl hydrolase family 17 protein [Maribacter polysaccharolyticus]
MEYTKALHIEPGNAICYSGFREGQNPGGVYPSYEEVKEDLLILENHWKYLRLYDCDEHTDIVLDVIRKEKLDFKVMLGAYIVAEANNYGCPWGGGSYSEEQLEKNKRTNGTQIEKLIHLANQFPDIIFALSAGNEACVDWTDHYVPVDSVIKYVKMIKKGAKQPVTFCENYLPWLDKLKDLVEAVDFISIHTYPVWEYKNIHEALEYTKQNYYAVADTYPHKPVVITEAGWTTFSNGKGICPSNVSEEHQNIYYNDLVTWSAEASILTFVFEAFDEPWKGSPEAHEPEKHWGLFKVDRTPKLVMAKLLAKEGTN